MFSVHGKQKDDKMPFYLAALWRPQLLTPQEVVEVINTFKGDTLFFVTQLKRDNTYRVKS